MRRLLGRAALTFAVTAPLVLGLGAGSATAASPSLGLTMSGSHNYRVAINSMDVNLYTPAFSSIFNGAAQGDDLNRQMAVPCPSTVHALDHADASVITSRRCWQDASSTDTDAWTKHWIPQGITGISDAQDDEQWGTNPQKPIITTWYSKDEGKGVRLSIIDPATNRYRLLLLVEPYLNSANHGSYRPVDIHAGGIAWYGHFLFVPDTSVGIRVFDLEHVFDLNPLSGPSTQPGSGTTTNLTDKTHAIGRYNNVYYSFGYRYLIPQVATWNQASAAPSGNDCKTTDKGMRFSYLSVNRGGKDSLVAGSYCSGSFNGWMAGYSLSDIYYATDQANGTGDTSYVPANYVWTLPTSHIQGAVFAGSTWYFSSSSGCDPSVLGAYTRNTSDWTLRASHKIGVGSEDLYLWRNGPGGPTIYSLTEWAEVHWTCSPSPGRVVFGITPF